MNLTPKQLREESDERKAKGQHYLADIFYQCAAALDELAAVREELRHQTVNAASGRIEREVHADALEELARLKAENEALAQTERDLRRIIERGRSSTAIELSLSAEADKLRDGAIQLLARAERAESALAESRQRCKRLEVHAEAMAGTIERSMGYVNAAKSYRAEFKGEK